MELTTNQTLITGAYGFLGSYIRRAFEQSHVPYLTLGQSDLNDIQINLAKDEPELDNRQIDRVVHAAGLAHHIPKGRNGAQKFYDVNLEGTENLLFSLVPIADQLKQFIYISTVAVYGRLYGEMVNENAPLQGKSPYAQSKMYAEEQVIKWCEQYNVPGLILRLPVVAGRNAPQRIRDIIKGIEKGRYLRIGDGKARKSMILAEDLALHILKWQGRQGIYNLTDGYHPSLFEIESYIARQLNLDLPRSMPDWQARILSGIGDLVPGFKMHSRLYQSITSEMTFDDSKARKQLDWKPRRVIDVDWM